MGLPAPEAALRATVAVAVVAALVALAALWWLGVFRNCAGARQRFSNRFRCSEGRFRHVFSLISTCFSSFFVVFLRDFHGFPRVSMRFEV